ncbi:phenoloxidase-activating factor 3-like [Neocloeon triangulifer]|uniref:phenoloxidase-activating factor 3-like n=1 Tax=Neocloeon triangulifer TaxID=2078957 RepID=UPI00286F3CF6|nr:phenoloxidase-activating factor 3-like [Neocloeon triangulifer]XP_059470183.1 phenoloxidase-activating factor 3-like [Neocloeon triangulifer]
MRCIIVLLISLFLHDFGGDACSSRRKSNKSSRLIQQNLHNTDRPDCDCVPLHTCPLFGKVLQGPRPISNFQLSALRRATCDPLGDPKNPNVKCCGKYVDEIEIGENGILGNVPTTLPPSIDFEQFCGQCDPSLDPRIIGGTEAMLGQFPWIARLGYINGPADSKADEFLCGGSLISHEHVVTAAHCINRDKHLSQLRWVVLGEVDERTDPDCTKNEGCALPVQTIKISWAVVHPQYKSSSFKNDIGVIKLAERVNFTSWVHPICLPKKQETNLTNVRAVVAGWGKIALDPAPISTSPKLQFLWKKVVTEEYCTRQYRGALSAPLTGQLCAGGTKGEDSCKGDSGGPLAQPQTKEPGGDGFYSLIGVVSFGARECGSGGLPGVYTKVSDYVDWIAAVTRGEWSPDDTSRNVYWD